MSEEITFTVIPDLLHEAYLAYIAWKVDECVLDLYWGNCLIRNSDGTEIKDRTILLRCADITGIAAGTEPLDCFAKPSMLLPPGEVDAGCLEKGKNISESWKDCDESWLAINKRRVEQEIFHSLRTVFLAGIEKDIIESPVRIMFNVPGGSVSAGGEYEVTILAGCSQITVYDGNGEPKDLATWDALYAAWWAGWKKHWDDKPLNDPDGYEQAIEDTMIPAGEDETDPDYQPPQEPPFMLSAHDVPEDLLTPLRNWFEGSLKRDWLQIARAWTWGDEVAEWAGQRSSGEPLYEWGYARAVDEWWQEGEHAVVTLRGIRHQAPFPGSPDENREIVWKFALRCWQGTWVLQRYTYSLPIHGSALSLPASRKLWLKEWHSGPIITKRKKVVKT
jgi:hypothetical protein